MDLQGDDDDASEKKEGQEKEKPRIMYVGHAECNRVAVLVAEVRDIVANIHGLALGEMYDRAAASHKARRPGKSKVVRLDGRTK